MEIHDIRVKGKFTVDPGRSWILQGPNTTEFAQKKTDPTEFGFIVSLWVAPPLKNLGHFTNSLATCASRRQGSATSVVPSATSVAQPAGCAGFQPGSRAPATNSTRTAKKSGARAPLPRLTTHSLHCSKPTLPHWPPPTLSRASRAPTDNSSPAHRPRTRLAQQKKPVLARRSHAPSLPRSLAHSLLAPCTLTRTRALRRERSALLARPGSNPRPLDQKPPTPRRKPCRHCSAHKSAPYIV